MKRAQTRLALPAAAAALCLISLSGDLEGRRRTPSAEVGVHIVYSWQERVDRIPIQHEIHLYGNGFMRYAQRAGAGALQETTLPNDRAFVDRMVESYRALRKARVSPPCGAPQGVVLQVRLARRTTRIPLDDPKGWNRYGRLVRAMVARVVGSVSPPLEADCQRLRLRVDPNRIATRPRTSPLPTRARERELLLAFGAAPSGQGRVEALFDLARIREGDRFFRWALLRRYPGSVQARRLVRRHAAELVRSVRNVEEARELLGHLGQLMGPEGRYHRAILQLVLGYTERAARNLVAFHGALNQLGSAREAGKRVRALGVAQVDSRRRRPPWRPIRRSFARQFVFWHRLARRVWGGDPDRAPPLAILLYRRALHFARVSGLSPSVRATSGGPVVVRAARALVRTHFPRLARGRWTGLRHIRRQDLLAVTGYLRRHRGLFPKGWVAQNTDSFATTVCRMIRMRYFDVARRFIERLVEQRKAAEGDLRLAQGRCLLELERFGAARTALARAVILGAVRAQATLAAGLLDQGDLGGSERVLAAMPKGSAAGLMVESRLWRLRGQPDRAVTAARTAVAARRGSRSLLALARSLGASGRVDAARKAFQEAASGTADGRLARLAWARMELDQGNHRAALDAAWPLGRAPERRIRAAAHAVMGLAAGGLAMGPLSSLQVSRALYHAERDPEALVEVADVRIGRGRHLGAALDALRLARGLRPGWSRVHELFAYLFGQLRRLPLAMGSISTALSIRPDYPPYRALERALVRLGSGR